ncbi:sterol 22-desaturase [Marchantia polymorpha subsp. ruderalis]|uniref:sterol 22-desaturase n=2 Tax=Marchantia polymorpha TaxID=3197 RepID=A0AAF6AJZ1_MARPO|nr:hypothetical protein MARPO_0103s0038 [Marchantia polymorpha]BBM96761.1 hypothetical protein Mp_1g00490 [Marchantia polymorpha subsp. ruderalis]|eukprot:PTQ32067.1 hypothetical protein MARPO_0103s0038 [Marchantia polymorpha]
METGGMEFGAPRASSSWWAEWQLVVGVALAIWLVYEQLSYIWKGKHLPGPKFVVPFLGDVFRMVKDPTKFWDDQAKAATKVGLSWNVLFGRFVLFVRDSEMSQKIFANVKPDVFHLVGHPFGKKLFGEDNLIFMFGDEHRDLRRRLAPNFTYKALGVYVSIQERMIRKHIAQWLEMHKAGPMTMRLLLRDLNLETSQATFVGPYLDEAARVQFKKDYNFFNTGLMSFPVNLPGFAYHEATKAVPRLIKALSNCSRMSRERMIQGEEPSCLIDFLVQETLREIQEAEAAGGPPPGHSSDWEIGALIFDFLFAAQDASTSSLAWSCAFLDSHPEILQRVRDEQRRVRPDVTAPVTPEMLKEMEFTTMVVKEVLRIRPPAPMVPHIASTDFAITDTYKVPKGTIVFPSLLESSFQGFTDPYKFDPDRFSLERQEDVLYKRNWLLFGAGPHQCVGQRYALNHLTLFVALFTTLVDMERLRTPGCDDLLYTPTISPKDELMCRMTARVVS